MNSVHGRAQSGVALVMVMWFVAAMSLLVAGVVWQARVDTQLTQLHLARAKVVAAGDGAIHLAMAQRYMRGKAGAAEPVSRHLLGELEVSVVASPASLFIDLNRASPQVLAVLFSQVGSVEPGRAKYLADNVVKWRQTRKGAGRGLRFESPEDLLLVEGFERKTLDEVRDYVIAGSWVVGAGNAPLSPEALRKLVQSRNAGQLQAAWTQALAGVAKSPAGSVLRVDAILEYGGRTWLRRRWMMPQPGAGSKLPWRALRTEPPRVVSFAGGNKGNN